MTLAVKIPLILQERIPQVMRDQFGIDLGKDSDLKILAADVMQMSDFYADNASAMTPWSEIWCRRAQLAYFLPLNVIRLRKVFREGLRLGFFDPLHSSIDFGAGLGAVAFAAAEEFLLHGQKWIPPREIEISKTAQHLRGDLSPCHSSLDALGSERSDLLISSYALTELAEIDALTLLRRFDSLMIVEPSTREDGRRLSRFRDALLKAGAFAWAPCTHQDGCPLLEHSATDWCHDRVHVDPPPWMQALEKQMPIKNRTLTHSYLLISKRPPPDLHGWARLTGDALKEKGKTRQLFCRGNEREFLAWMSRHGEFPEYPRGELIRVPLGEKKSNELRTQESLSFFHKG